MLRGDQPLVQALLDHGADPDAVLTRGSPARRVSADWRLPHRITGATPLWAAAWFREPRLVRLLAAHGADPRATAGGETAVMAAIRGTLLAGDASASYGRRLKSRSAMPPARVAAAIDAGTDVNSRRENGDTALHMAVSQRQHAVIAVLAERGRAARRAQRGRPDAARSRAGQCGRRRGRGTATARVALLRSLAGRAAAR